MVINARTEAAARYRAGETVPVIAGSYALAAATVRRWLVEDGLVAKRASKGPIAGDVASAYAAGEPVASITARYDIDFKTLRRMIDRAGVAQRRLRLKPEQRLAIHARLRQGEAAACIAAEVGVHPSTVHRLRRLTSQSSG